MQHDALTGKTVLVTGADGFIGSHLVESLVAAGATVRAMALYNSFNDWGWLESIPRLSEVEVITGDVRDSEFVRQAVKGIDTIFHLAALIAIPHSYRAPRSYIETNVIGTLNVLQAARDNDVRRVLVSSTSEVYGTAKYIPIDENHSRQPQSPYSASKIAADSLAESFYLSFETPIVIVRPFNTYGPRQSARAVIPTIIGQLLAGRTTIKLGHLHPTRDLNFVRDTCRGFLSLSLCDQAVGKSVNIGSGREISVGDLAKQIARIVGVEVEFEQDRQRLRPAASEVERLLSDNRLAQALVGYSPEVSLEQGLRETIEWFMESKNRARYKSDIYNV